MQGSWRVEGKSHGAHGESLLVPVLHSGMGVIDPDGAAVRRWETGQALLLLLVALWTPFEAAGFLDAGTPSGLVVVDAAFLANRVIDALFFADMALCFALPFRAFAERGGGMQTRRVALWNIGRRDIAMRYLKGWFLVDLLAIFPFELTALVRGKAEWRGAGFLRLLRLLRLLKLLRVLRGNAALRRWHERSGVSFSALRLLKFAVVIVGMSHWVACVWGMIGLWGLERAQRDAAQQHGSAAFEDGWPEGTTWLEHYFSGRGGWSTQRTSTLYTSSLYWAVTSMTTIGYGDIVGQSHTETAVAVVCMLIGAAVYSYVVGGVSNVVHSMDPLATKYLQRVDQVNTYMSENNFPRALRERVREYFSQSRALSRIDAHRAVLAHMSPALRNQCIAAVNLRWVRSVSFFKRAARDCERRAFLTELAMAVEARAFAKGEILVARGSPADSMIIVQQGVVRKRQRVGGVDHVVTLLSGAALGADMIVPRSARRRGRPYDVVAVTFVLLGTLRRDSLLRILERPQFHGTRAAFLRIVWSSVFREEFIRYARTFEALHGRRAAREYVPAEHNTVRAAVAKGNHSEKASALASPPNVRPASAAQYTTLQAQLGRAEAANKAMHHMLTHIAAALNVDASATALE